MDSSKLRKHTGLGGSPTASNSIVLYRFPPVLVGDEAAAGLAPARPDATTRRDMPVELTYCNPLIEQKLRVTSDELRVKNEVRFSSSFVTPLCRLGDRQTAAVSGMMAAQSLWSGGGAAQRRPQRATTAVPPPPPLVGPQESPSLLILVLSAGHFQSQAKKETTQSTPREDAEHTEKKVARLLRARRVRPPCPSTVE